MKYKIRIIEIDECVEDVEFFVDFMFLDSNVRFNAALFCVKSKMLYSLLGQEITAELILENTRCKQNKEKKYSWLNCKLASDYTDTWLNPADIQETKELSCAYLCSGKILCISILNELSRDYYRLQSERTIDVDTHLMRPENDDIKLENIHVGEFYSFRGGTYNQVYR